MKIIFPFAKKTIKLLSAFFPLLILFALVEKVPAQESASAAREQLRFEMEEIVVTASRQEERISSIPKNVTVITSEDIEQSTAGNIVELLGREANLNLRSFTGNEGRSGVDIRGMGDTYVSNVIVMVDGVRMNATDMSGADFLSIPMGQVERIEIVRGGSSVLYGNGAVGGVVNIITKRPDKPVSGKISAVKSSFNTYNSRFQAGARQDRFSIGLIGGYSDSKGYRDNGYLRNKDAALSVSYETEQFLLLSADVSMVDSAIGLPGPLSKEEMEDRDKRRRTDAPDDFSDTKDRRCNLKAELKTGFGDLTLKGGVRDRDNEYVIGYTPLLSEEEQTDVITEDAVTLSLVHDHKFSLGRYENSIVSGVDFYKTDYLREDQNSEKKNGKTTTIEGFFYDNLALNKSLSLNFGCRYSKFSGTFQDENYVDFFGPNPSPGPPFILLYSAYVPEDPIDKNWNNHAYELGFTWQVLKSVSFFASHSQSYRIPNVDEFALSDSDLEPQESRHFDAGIRSSIGDLLEWSLTGFLIRTTDEIYYGENPETNTSVNRNYDQKTERKGIEAEIKLYPSDWLYFWGNYSYTRATFEGTGKFIPLVPEHMGNFGLEWYLHDSLTIALSGTAASPRFDGNDQENEADEYVLESYQVYDVKITWHKDRFRLFAGINNIADTLYVTSAYSGSGYPMPERSFYVGVEWTY